MFGKDGGLWNSVYYEEKSLQLGQDLQETYDSSEAIAQKQIDLQNILSVHKAEEDSFIGILDTLPSDAEDDEQDLANSLWGKEITVFKEDVEKSIQVSAKLESADREAIKAYVAKEIEVAKKTHALENEEDEERKTELQSELDTAKKEHQNQKK